MKKIPVTEQQGQRSTTSVPGEAAVATPAEEVESEDEIPRLQADLDRFRDLAMRSQADFENYKKRCAREKDEAVKYANRELLDRLVAIGVLDRFIFTPTATCSNASLRLWTTLSLVSARLAKQAKNH